ncbi:MAG: tRNA dihydrouridine synthase DusB [Alphaproteobacteria bacterium]|nr:tRNA dihydrouridine synthase DusB [Alphaproteobacteria bacterium]
MAFFLNSDDFKLILAPMEDVSDPPFRVACKQAGADIVISEFISSEGLIRHAIKSKKKLEFYPEERPFGIQIFGGDEEAMRLSAQIVEAVEPDFIDINFGCPVKKIVTKGAGAYVLKDLDLMVKLTSAVVKRTRLPVTVKTRLGWDDQSINIQEVAVKLQDCGIAALSIHARTRCQMYKGHSNWDYIADVKNNPVIKIPIFGNGDINSPEKALEYKTKYGVDGIMIGRAAIGHPWIFRDIKHYFKTGNLLPPPNIHERIDICKQHLIRSVAWKGKIVGINEMKRHYAQYLKGLPDIKHYRNKLVITNETDEIIEILNTIEAAYTHFEFKPEPIELINYHATCN